MIKFSDKKEVSINKNMQYLQNQPKPKLIQLSNFEESNMRQPIIDCKTIFFELILLAE